MTVVHQFAHTAAPTPQNTPDDTQALLNQLRFHAARCRASVHLNIYAACLLIDPKTENNTQLYMMTLVRIIDQALGKRAVFLRTGTHEKSFDEAWLTALFAAYRRNDAPSYHFLLRSRVAKAKYMVTNLLIMGLAKNLPK